MYWPTTTSRTLEIPAPLNKHPLLRIQANRRGNAFAVITKDGLGVWDPTVMQAAVTRTTTSIERWGENIDVFWAYDGKGIIILTNTSHLLFYQLTPTNTPAYDQPSTSTFPSIAGPGEGDTLIGWTIQPLGTAFLMGGCTSIHPQSHSLLITLRHPPSVLSIPYPLEEGMMSPAGSHFPPKPLDGGDIEGSETWDLGEGENWMSWDTEQPPIPQSISVHRTPGLAPLHVLSTKDGRIYAMYSPKKSQRRVTAQANSSDLTDTVLSPASSAAPGTSPTAYFTDNEAFSKYTGQVIHPQPQSTGIPDDAVTDGVEALGLIESEEAKIPQSSSLDASDRALEVAVNGKFGLIAVGLTSGIVSIISLPPYPSKSRFSHSLDLKSAASLRESHLRDRLPTLRAGLGTSPGCITSLSWTADGYGLAVGYERGWAVWSMGGRLGGWGTSGVEDDSEIGDGQHVTQSESFMRGVSDLFWVPGNLELFVLSKASEDDTAQLHVIPFVKSATTGQHSPDNTRYAFLQTDDRVLVYRGADQPDMSVINPESDVWQHIKIPNAYIATNWPIRYASISSDGKLIAVAGRRGLTHYSASSGRWKLFADERMERDFVVKGGILWFHHVLIAAVEVDKSYQIRLYSRDLDLVDTSILHSTTLPSPVLVMTLLDNSLLVYTADNMLYHFLILPTKDTLRLHLCGSISFGGIVMVPSRVRALSWLIPPAQKDLGDPADDLIVATIIFLVDGRLVLLRPRRVGNEEVRYDMQVLADRIETYWTHLHGVGTLENSLWGYDGSGMRVWLDALTIEATRVDNVKDAYMTVKESVYLRLDFYPLSILMDKGIIIGVDYEPSTRHLPFSLFKIQTGTHLFLPQFLRYHLTPHHLAQALQFAINYSSIVYFAHSLEILLHSVLEDEVESGDLQVLPHVIEFLDYFPESLDVVVGVARKTEVERWKVLFDVVGQPRELFEKCLESGMLRTAASYLLVLQNLEEVVGSEDTVRLLKLALAGREYHLCKELLRFLHSIDETGDALKSAISEISLVPPKVPHPASPIAAFEVPTPASQSTTPVLSPSTGSDRARHLRVHSKTGVANSPFQLSTARMWKTPPSPMTVDTMDEPLEVPEASEERH